MSLPQWEDYWKTGWVVSCPTGPMSGYTGALRSCGNDFSRALPVEHGCWISAPAMGRCR